MRSALLIRAQLALELGDHEVAVADAQRALAIALTHLDATPPDLLAETQAVLVLAHLGRPNAPRE